MARSVWATLALALSLASAAPACSGAAESIALIGGEKVDAASIDEDPLVLLPGGVVMLGYIDARAMFATSLGPDMSRLATNLVPLGPESNFVPSRDVVRIYGGVYAMQGADACAVVQGNFDVEAIRRSADARAVTSTGVPLVKTRYADNDIFTAGNVGFVVLTSHTLLTGNETGMRRALDRLRFGARASDSGKLARSVPSWMIDLTATRGAAFAVAGDFSSQVPVGELAREVPFVANLQRLRVIGNFQPPGLNFAGALTYPDPQSAATGAAALRNVQQLTQLVGFLYSLGFGSSIPPMQVAVQQNDVAFTLPMDDKVFGSLLRLAAPSTTPASAKQARR